MNNIKQVLKTYSKITLTDLSILVNIHKENLVRYLKIFALKKDLNFRIDEMNEEIEFLFDNPDDLLFDSNKLKESYSNVTSIQNEMIGMNCIKN